MAIINPDTRNMGTTVSKDNWLKLIMVEIPYFCVSFKSIKGKFMIGFFNHDPQELQFYHAKHLQHTASGLRL